MKLILNQDVEFLGAVGVVVIVKPGYARNYLLPRGFAVAANDQNKSALEHHMRLLDKRKAHSLAAAKTLAVQIERTSITVSKPVGEEEKIFGSVTTSELEELLSQEGIKVSKKDISLIDDIKKVGVYAAQVKLHPEITAKFKVWVVAQ